MSNAAAERQNALEDGLRVNHIALQNFQESQDVQNSLGAENNLRLDQLHRLVTTCVYLLTFQKLESADGTQKSDTNAVAISASGLDLER